MSEPVIPELRHGMNCGAWHSEQGHEVNSEDCTCGYRWRVYLETEKTLKAAWEKRAYEAEAKVAEQAATIKELTEIIRVFQMTHTMCIPGWDTYCDICRRADAALTPQEPQP